METKSRTLNRATQAPLGALSSWIQIVGTGESGGVRQWGVEIERGSVGIRMTWFPMPAHLGTAVWPWENHLTFF